MNRYLIGCLSTLWVASSAAQVMECVDAKGRKEFAQTCPPGTVKETKRAAPASGGTGNTGTASKSLAEQDADFRKRALARQEAEAKAEKEKTETKDASRNCNDARAQLKQLQDGSRIAKTDPNTGERSFLQDKERPAEITSAQKAVDGWCNNKK
jgi:uncharacterized protein YaiL (DUF2058 family)